MTRLHPVSPAAPGARSGVPDRLRAGLGIGTTEDIAPLVAFLASAAGRAVSGQAIGIGGDRLALWSHPAEIGVETRRGGWTAEAIAAAWAGLSHRRLQPFGMQLEL